jgi:antitoxin VapB
MVINDEYINHDHFKCLLVHRKGSYMTEFLQKQSRILDLLNQKHLDGFLLQRASSFAWATCGAASYVNTATSLGAASLFITPYNRYLISNTIEAPRLEKEEKLKYQGWDFTVSSWYEQDDTIERLTKGLRIGADHPYPNAVDLDNEIARLRANLTQEEGIRFRVLGRLCAEAIPQYADKTGRPTQIAARLILSVESRIQPIVSLVPLTNEFLRIIHCQLSNPDRYAMLVLWPALGIGCSIPLDPFWNLPENLRRKAGQSPMAQPNAPPASR